ncbi:MAG: histidine phosphatase family protein [Rhodospirillaceae bacterium]|nr:histidine phosphatase family protein [Rhodospirillales bacterium]
MAARMTEMRQIFLLRHAKSSWDDPAVDDFERGLNNRGRKAARIMAKYLGKTRIRPAMILCSAATRTRATFEIIAPKLAGVPVSFENELYEAAKGDLLDRLHRLDDHLQSVMLIGHNPGLERLTSFLCTGHGEPQALSRLAEKFPTGALAVLETKAPRWAGLDEGDCRLVDFVRPGDLAD